MKNCEYVKEIACKRNEEINSYITGGSGSGHVLMNINSDLKKLSQELRETYINIIASNFIEIYEKFEKKINTSERLEKVYECLWYILPKNDD